MVWRNGAGTRVKRAVSDQRQSADRNTNGQVRHGRDTCTVPTRIANGHQRRVERGEAVGLLADGTTRLLLYLSEGGRIFREDKGSPQMAEGDSQRPRGGVRYVGELRRQTRRSRDHI